ncbi:hypothetical protein FZ103_12175 [Streptomonospora sp. PA3]|nr:hypothetical protein [Streptomonospora sp. PA3]
MPGPVHRPAAPRRTRVHRRQEAHRSAAGRPTSPGECHASPRTRRRPGRGGGRTLHPRAARRVRRGARLGGGARRREPVAGAAPAVGHRRHGRREHRADRAAEGHLRLQHPRQRAGRSRPAPREPRRLALHHFHRCAVGHLGRRTRDRDR